MSEQTLTRTEPATPATTAARLIAAADQFTEADFDVRSPSWGDNAYLFVTNVPGARCELTITRSGTVTWDYHVGATTPAHSAQAAEIVLALLAPDSHVVNPALDQHRYLTFKGLVGRALKRSGMSATLQVLDLDQTIFEVHSEVCASNPAHPERGFVQVSDLGAIWWNCQLNDELADDAGLSLTDVVQTIVKALAPITSTI